MLCALVASVYSGLVYFGGQIMMVEPKETPSPSPVPHWEETCKYHYNWSNITVAFTQACEGLKLGELVHESNFGLYEAMSAIEMMDPKMDAGMAGGRSKRQVPSFKERISDESIKLKDFELCELISIMDTCQTCILSWLEGQSLAQTVFTCLFLHEPDLIEDRVLRAYCIAVLKLCDLIKEKIFTANVFEEEDFQTLTYGFKFAGQVSPMRAVGMLRECEDDVSRSLRISKSQPATPDEPALLQAVLARLKFVRLFLQLLSPFGNKEKEVLQGNRKLLGQLSEQLTIIDKTTNLGLASSNTDDGHEVSYGFDPLVNQRLLPPTFPRYTKLRSKNEIGHCYGELIKCLLSVVDMTTLTSFQSILDFIVEFSHSEPSVLSRSIAQITFLPENRRIFATQPLGEALRESIRTFNSPPSLSTKFPNIQSNLQVKSCLDSFLIRATRTMAKLVQAYGHNYARQREKLSAVLEDLGILQDEADRCDTDINALMHALDPNAGKSHLTCVGSWALYHTLRVMTQYIVSGFVLQLYSDHEYHYIYWYLAEVLLSWQLTTLNRAEGQLQSDESLADPTPSNKQRSHKKAKKNKKKCKVHAREIVLTQGMQMMAAGCFKALLGFFLEGKMRTPDFSFDNEGIRYEHRFSPFISVGTPPFMPYKQFQEMTDVGQYFPAPTAQDLYLSSSKHFAQAKQAYESIAAAGEIQNLLLVAKTNLVMTKLLAGGHKQSSSSRPQFDFTVNSIFPIIRVL
uniref:N-alpha-acetyltransferase 35, NatC auxiliary subunit n=2 Tax=Ciona savignyi TaxID=51511 RepID=H2ZHX8_CIOSA